MEAVLQDRPAGGAQGQGRGRGRRPRRDRRPGRRPSPRPPPRPRRATAAPETNGGTERAGRSPSRRDAGARPEEPADIPPAEQAPTTPPTAPANGETAPSGGTAPRRLPAQRARRHACLAAPSATASTTEREPAAQNRHGSSAALVIPMRGPTSSSRRLPARPRRLDRDRPAEQVRAVEVELDVERLGQLAGAGAEVLAAARARGARASRRAPRAARARGSAPRRRRPRPRRPR